MLSLCMIIKNEEQFIEQCLLSVKGLVDEIIIVDTGSSDRTIELAKKHNAQVFSVPWENDFSKARNAALSHAQGTWILVLDADEALDPVMHDNVRECIKDPLTWAFRIPIFNYSDDATQPGWSSVTGPLALEFSGFVLTRVARLFRRRPEITYQFSVHEGVEFSIEEHHGIMRNAPFVIHHYGARRGNASVKQETYFSLVQQDCKQYPQHPKPFYELGVGYLDIGDFDKAKAAFEQAIKNNDHYLMPYHYLAEIAVHQGDFQQAKAFFEKSLSLRESEETHFRLGQVLLKLQDISGALVHWGKALEKNPRSIRYFDALIQLHLVRKEFLQALALLHDACTNTQHLHFMAEKDRVEQDLIAQAKKTLANGPEKVALATLATIALYRREKNKVIALCDEAKKHFTGAGGRIFDALREKA
ncbi:glycosyltransferase [Candidatus Woesearchaeota archaeon]|nr:glycosyltransferase [Candidatus Woesearchaeota archaeon]